MLKGAQRGWFRLGFGVFGLAWVCALCVDLFAFRVPFVHVPIPFLVAGQLYLWRQDWSEWRLKRRAIAGDAPAHHTMSAHRPDPPGP
jgi:hypothetical protein